MSKQAPATPSMPAATSIMRYADSTDEATVLRIAREGLRANPPVVRFVGRERTPPHRLMMQL